MIRLLSIGCAAALLITAVAYSQSVTPPGVATNPATGTTTGSAATAAPVPLSTAAPATGQPAPVPTGNNFIYSNTTAPGGLAPPNTDVLYVAPGEIAQNTPWLVGKQGRPVDPETFELTKRDRDLSGGISQLAASYKDLPELDAKAAEVRQEIAKMVAEQFEIRQKLRQKQLAALEEQVKRLRALHDQRTEQRDRIVTDRVQQVLREATGLGWGDIGASDYADPIKLKMFDEGDLNRRTVIRKIGKPGEPTTTTVDVEVLDGASEPKRK